MRKFLLIFLLSLLLFLVPLFINAKSFLFIGDSITDGNWGSPIGWPCPSENRSKTDMNHIYGHGFPQMIAAYCQGTWPDSQYEFFNRGISGNTLKDLEERWGKDATDLNPDVISILIGTNDINEWLEKGEDTDFDFQDWENRFRALLDKTLSINPNVQFVLTSPFVAKVGNIGDKDNYLLRENSIEQLRAIVSKIADCYGATYVDFNKRLKDAYAAHPNLGWQYWIWDGIHPTPAAHYLMAQLWISKVAL